MSRKQRLIESLAEGPKGVAWQADLPAKGGMGSGAKMALGEIQHHAKQMEAAFKKGDETLGRALVGTMLSELGVIANNVGLEAHAPAIRKAGMAIRKANKHPKAPFSG